MDAITTLFGIPAQEIKPLCIVTPYLTHHLRKALNIKEMIKGKIYHCAQLPHATLIKSGVGASLTGDCILWLENTPCERILFVGSAGAIDATYQVGSIVTVETCLAADGFSSLLHEDLELLPCLQSHCSFTQQLKQTFDLPIVNALSFASLKLEEDYVETFQDHHIDVIDMECAAAFCAAEHIRADIAALLYITDIIGLYPFWQSLRETERPDVINAIHNTANIIQQLT